MEHNISNDEPETKLSILPMVRQPVVYRQFYH